MGHRYERDFESNFENMRVLGMLKLLDVYGGMTCPISFLCMRDLYEMYSKGTEGDKMFVCETTNRSITSTLSNYYPFRFLWCK